MTKDFIGSITIDGDVYPVLGVLSIRGRRITGTLRFEDNDLRLIPINFLVDGGVSTFHTNAPTLFLTPDGDLVVIDEVQSGSTTLDLETLSIEIADEDCLLNDVAVLCSLSLSPAPEEGELVGVEDVSEEEILVVTKTLSPIRINQIGNRMDHYGDLLSTPRLLDEKNTAYRTRIIKAVGEPSGSTYQGLIRGGCRELGLEISDSILVTKRSGITDPEKAVFSIEEDRAIIYSNWVSIEQQAPGTMPTVEQEITLVGLSVGKLVDWINFSSLFRARLVGDGEVSATKLLVASTNSLIQERLSPSEKIKMKEPPLRGTLFIGSGSGLRRELTENDRSLIGDYSVDYDSGFINPLFTPNDDLLISYMANVSSLTLKYAPIRITSMTSEGGRNLLFNQVEREFYKTERGRYTEGIPTNEMFFFLREIMNGGEFSQFWGE